MLDGIWSIAADDQRTFRAALRRTELTTDRELHLLAQFDPWVIRSCGPNPRAYVYPSREQFAAEAWRRHEVFLATPLVPAVLTLADDVQWMVAARAVATTYLTSYMRGIDQIAPADIVGTSELWIRTMSADAIAGIMWSDTASER